MKRNHFSSRKGFTLIEILVVIAMIGALAGGLFVAINPLEKVARAKDATKKATASQLVNALQTYYVSNGAVYPPADNVWITALVNNGDIKNVPPVVTSSCTTNNQNGYCYKLSDDGTEAIVYTSLESSERPSGTSGTTPYFLWSSAIGESGTYYSFSADITETSGIVFGPSSTLTQGLVGWWKMDGNAKDSTPNSNNGTVTGAILTTDRKGQVDKAYSFDGVNDKVNAGNSSSLQISGNLTVGYWIKLGSDAATRGYEYTVSKGMGWANGWWFQKDVNSMNIGFDMSGPGTYFSSGRVALTANVWAHIVGVYDGSYLYLYKDGKYIKKGAAPPTSIPGYNVYNLYFGIAGNGANYPTKGLIDDVRIYNRALSASEVTNLFNADPQ
ncbi:MAG: LamG-like jellyroll fold domain-containing protein [Candidatus Levybacteria bacterium]|nr:LamG-like jellyroll fold domain-containing protein [Candidatus Levybacteria bacterium]